MQQGYSGSFVQRKDNLVEKVSTDQTFIHSPARQHDLIALSRKLDILPRIERIEQDAIFMDFVAGQEGLNENNAYRVGQALRQLHAESDYQHPCMTGVEWLIDMANDNLSSMGYPQRISPDYVAEYSDDALIHAEPVQVIEKPDGSIVFIDFEGIGRGSRYQDLAFIYYIAFKQETPELYANVVAGYQAEGGHNEAERIKRLAGIIALAYAGFAESEQRMRLGFQWLRETGINQFGSPHPTPNP